MPSDISSRVHIKVLRRPKPTRKHRDGTCSKDARVRGTVVVFNNHTPIKHDGAFVERREHLPINVLFMAVNEHGCVQLNGLSTISVNRCHNNAAEVVVLVVLQPFQYMCLEDFDTRCRQELLYLEFNQGISKRVQGPGIWGHNHNTLRCQSQFDDAIRYRVCVEIGAEDDRTRKIVLINLRFMNVLFDLGDEVLVTQRKDAVFRPMVRHKIFRDGVLPTRCDDQVVVRLTVAAVGANVLIKLVKVNHGSLQHSNASPNLQSHILTLQEVETVRIPVEILLIGVKGQSIRRDK
mmetsp:Transcript_45996/g.53206  ORF Transcript_45996/g.53206 Transcript_45996/m.53206 type:complete len:292 (+) Transcript_45996:233-1108(+)